MGIQKCPALHSPCVVARHGKSTADPKHRIHRFTDPEQISSTRTLPLRILANFPLFTGVRKYKCWSAKVGGSTSRTIAS